MIDAIHRKTDKNTSSPAKSERPARNHILFGLSGCEQHEHFSPSPLATLPLSVEENDKRRTSPAPMPALGSTESRNMIRSVIPDLDNMIDIFAVSHFELDEEILDAFRMQFAIHVSGSRAALAYDDFERLQIEAHSVKGMGGAIGSPEVSVLGLKIEEAARNRDSVRCGELVGVMRRWYNTFLRNA